MLRSVFAFRAFARPYRRVLMAGALLAVLEVVVRLAEPWPLRLVVDHVLHVPARDWHGIAAPRGVLAMAVASLVLVVGCAALLDYWSSRMLAAAGLHLANDVRGAVFDHLSRLSLRYHGSQQVGDLASRVTSDVDRAQDMVVQALSVIGPNLMLMVGMFAVMLSIDAVFALVALALTPLLAIAVHRSTTLLKQTSRRARKADGQVAAAATETLGVMPLVQAYSLEGQQRDAFDRLAGASVEAGLEAARLQARFSPMVDISGAVSGAVVLWFGANRVLSGRLSLGALLVFTSYLGSLYKPVKALSKLSTTMAKGAAAAERVRAVLDEAPEIADRTEKGRAVPAPPFAGRIELDAVTFAYAGAPVLRDVSLTIDAGESLALVGPTGAGKSTLVSLVARLIDPTVGAVRIDGLDLRDLQLRSVRTQVSMVLQDCVLLRGSLRDNIRLGRPDASDADVRRAASLALVDEFAARLPGGLDAKVGERGATLSGGQRQRIAIARAILRDAPILVLDEPTSALDPRSESMIVEALAHLPSGRTTLVVAHRLSTLRTVDRIAVLDGGRLVQLGTPQHLTATPGLYRELLAASSRRDAEGGVDHPSVGPLHHTPPMPARAGLAVAGR